MNKADYKKQKAGKSFPGDVSRRIKIAMIERPKKNIEVFPWQYITPQAARVYRAIVNQRKNKRFRQRSKAELNRTIIENYD